MMGVPSTTSAIPEHSGMIDKCSSCMRLKTGLSLLANMNCIVQYFVSYMILR